MDFRRLFELFSYQQARFPQSTALAIREDYAWKTYSTAECLAEIDRVSAGLLHLGLQRGDRVGLMTELGSPRWNFLDLGMLQIGVVNVPIHASVTREELEFIIRDAEVRYLVVANRELYRLVESVRSNVLTLKGIFTLEQLPDVPGWDQLVRHPSEQQLEMLPGLRGTIHEDDLATIIYTSGSTGMPKGVMLSHKNIVSNIKAVISLVPVNCDKRVLSMLPLSHIFERMVTYTYMAVGASIYYAGGPQTVAADLREVRPHYFTAVPRILERMNDVLLERAHRGNLLHRSLWRWAIRLGKRFRETGRMRIGYWIQRQIADLLVYRSWRRQLGGRIEGIMVGAAALHPDLGRLFSAAAIDIREGYGLTETSPVVAFNRFEPGGYRFGTVGIPIPGVAVRIDQPDETEEGEILVSGPNVMMGYYNNEEETKRVLTPDGWLRTGDLGRITHRRFLEVTGRKKALFKTTTGKFVAPEPLENRLISSPFIEQCLVVGANQPFPVALIVPCFPILHQWCVENQVHWTAPQFMVLNPKVLGLYQRELDRLNSDLPNHLQVRRFALLFQPWTADGGELTPTYKPRREVLHRKFEKEIIQLYQTPTKTI